MNQFQYVVMIDRISKLKTKKSKLELLRELQMIVAPPSRWGVSTYVEATNINELSLMLKCFIAVKNTLSEVDSNKLPLFITQTYSGLQNKFLFACVRDNASKEFLDDTLSGIQDITAKPSYLSVAGSVDYIIRKVPLPIALHFVNSIRDTL